MHLRQNEVMMAESTIRHQYHQSDHTQNTKEIKLDEQRTQLNPDSGSQSTDAQHTQNALGLRMSKMEDSSSENAGVEWPKSMSSTSDISRTPSQSTTGTSQSQNSLETAASSLQSTLNSNKEDLGTEKPLPLLPPESPKNYVTACSTPAENGQAKQEEDSLRRYHALLELVETERGYVDDLEVLISVFFSNLTSQSFFEESESRTAVVIRNASKLLELHSSLFQKWDLVLRLEHLYEYDQGTSSEKALRCGNAVEKIIEHLRDVIPQFHHYRLFCSRHSEAMVMIREAERRRGGDEYAAYERLCGNLIRTQSSRTSSAPNSRRHSLSRQSSGILGPLSPSAFVSSLTPMDIGSTKTSSSPSSGTTTPSSAYTGIPRALNSHRLLLADYLIKPIQRMCLYPLVLNSLLKYTPPQEMQTKTLIGLAIDQMRNVADEVDEASRIREKDLMTELILTRVESNPALPQTFLHSLGAPQLSGTLDVLHHHSIEDPLSVPLRFHRLGVVMWTDFILIVRPRKNGQLECRHWFPLDQVEIVPKIDVGSYDELKRGDNTTNDLPQSGSTMEIGGKTLVPHAFRLSFNAHHFEFSASSSRERRMWHDALRLAIEKKNKNNNEFPSCGFTALPNSLSSIPGMTSGAYVLSTFFLTNTKTSNAGNDGIENLIKLPSASTRVSIDRNMVFSDVLIAPAGILGVSNSSTHNGMNGGGNGGSSNAIGPSTVRQISEALIAHQLRQSAAPSIGSAVGAAMGFAKMAATQMPNVKRPRKMSSLTPLDFSVVRPPLTSTISEASGSSGSGSNSTPKLNTFIALQGTDSGSEAHYSPVESYNRRLSSPVESLSSRVKGTIVRANSRLSGRNARSTPGSLPTSPMASTVDLSKTAGNESSPQQQSNDELKSSHTRRRSITLRDVWNKRTRSQSAQLPVTMGPSYEQFTTVNQFYPQLTTNSSSGRPISAEMPSYLDGSAKSSMTESSLYGQAPFSESPTEESNRLYSTASSTNPSSRNLDSAPSSRSSSRRQSVVSIFNSSYTDLQRSIPAPLRTSSPVTNISMSHMREGAANTFKRAKSAARNRLNKHGSVSLLTNPASSLVAKPIASVESARGYFDTKSSMSNDDPSLSLGGKDVGGMTIDALANLSLEGSSFDEDSSLSRSNSAVDRLRGSLSRSVSVRTAKQFPSSTLEESETGTKNHFSSLEEDLLHKMILSDLSPQAERGPLSPILQEAGESVTNSAEQSKDESYMTAFEV